MNMNVRQLETVDAIPVVALLGLGRIPKDRTSAAKWFERNGITPQVATGDGRKPEFVSLLELPDGEQLAYRLKLAEEAGLAFGEQDDAAHIALMAKPVGVQATAHARAKVLGLVHKGRAVGLKWPQIAAQIEASGLVEVPCEQTVNQWFKRVEGVDPANWAPALAPDYKGRTTRAPMSDAAFDEFCALVAAWGRNGTGANLKKAWAKVAEKKAKQGWVAGWRAEVMADAGEALPPVVPKVVQLDTRGTFSPAGPIYTPKEDMQNAATAEMWANLDRMTQKQLADRAI